MIMHFVHVTFDKYHLPFGELYLAITIGGLTMPRTDFAFCVLLYILSINKIKTDIYYLHSAGNM